MAEEKIILFEVDFNTSESLEKTKQLKEQLQKTKEEFDNFRENSKKAGIELKDNDVIVLQHKANIKALEMQIKANENITLKLTQAQKANSNTIEQTRFALSAVSAQWAQESKIMGENSERAKELYEQKLRLTEALKAEEAATGDNRRNVGNYMQSAEALGKEMKILVAQMLAMSQAGKANSADFLELQKKLYETRDSINDLKDQTITYNKEVKGLEFAINIFNGLNDAVNMATGAMKLAGIENRDLEKSIEKLNTVISILNGVQQVSNLLQKDSAAVIFLTNMQLKAQILSTNLQTAADGKGIVARYAAIAAQKALNLVMKASPIGIIITALTALAGVVYLFTGRTEEAAKKQAKLNELQEAQIDIINKIIEANKRRSDMQLINYEKEIELLRANGATSQDLLKKEIELIEKKILANKSNALLIENEKNNLLNYEAAIETANAKIQSLVADRAKTNKTSAVEFYNTLIDNEKKIIEINESRISRVKSNIDEQIALEVSLSAKRTELRNNQNNEYIKSLEIENQINKAKAGNIDNIRLLEDDYYKDRRNLILNNYQNEQDIIKEKNRLGLITDKEANLERINLGNDYNAQLIELDKQRLDVITDNMLKEIEIWKLKNKSLLDDSGNITQELVDKENERLQMIYNKEQEVRDLRLKSNPEYLKQYEIDTLNAQIQLEEAKEKNQKLYNEKAVQSVKDIEKKLNEIREDAAKKGAYNEYQYNLEKNEKLRQDDLLWAENLKEDKEAYNQAIIDINSKYDYMDRQLKVKHYEGLISVANSFTSDLVDVIKQAYGENSGIAKAAAILNITVDSIRGQFAAFISAVESEIPYPYNLIAGGAAATLVLTKSIIAINDLNKVKTPDGGGGSTASIQSISGGGTGSVSAQTTQTIGTANAGIVNREYTSTLDREQGQKLSLQPTLVIDDVTAAQNQQNMINNTATI